MIDMTRDEARERVARAIGELRPTDSWPSPVYRMNMVCDADAALAILWPEIERLRAERDEARGNVVDAVALVERLSEAHRDVLALCDAMDAELSQRSRAAGVVFIHEEIRDVVRGAFTLQPSKRDDGDPTEP